MTGLRIVFMGTPEFAVPSLRALAQRYEVCAVVTQPDKPKGRGKQMCAPEVKVAAQELGLKVYQPQRVRDEAFLQEMQALAPDLILVAAYSRLIPKLLLDLPRLGCVNLHPSSLPNYRGAIPVQAALMNGEATTAVTTFIMDEGYDTGPWLLRKEVDILPQETGSELLERLALLGAQVLVDTVEGLAKGLLSGQPQVGEAQYTKPLQKADLVMDWSLSAEKLVNFVRALSELPGAQTSFEGQPLKVDRMFWVADEQGQPNPSCSAEVQQKVAACLQAWRDTGASSCPGTIIGLAKGLGPLISCGSGFISLERVKPAGKGWMEGWAFAQGRKLAVGQVLGH